MTLLQLKNVSHYFGGLVAVDDFNLDLQEGELVGLIGPNGAGKTTVFNLVTGAYRASQGQIIFAGEDLVGKPPHVINDRGISRTFQTIRLWNMMSVISFKAEAFRGGLPPLKIEVSPDFVMMH